MNNFQRNIYRTAVDTEITPSEEITIVSSISTVEQCGAGDDTKIVTSSITLSSAVTVDTNFVVRSTYSLNGKTAVFEIEDLCSSHSKLIYIYYLI